MPTITNRIPTKETAEEIEALGEIILYYPYIEPQAYVQVNSYTKRRAVGVDEKGEPIFEYIIDCAKESMVFAQKWLAARKARNDTAPTLS